jgi:DNA-binding NarL/FixJ family response regulator
VAVLDIRMPHLDGIEATRRIVAALGEDVRVLVLTTFGLDDYVFDALRAGASGFMLKDAPPEELLDAIRVVAAGSALLAPAVTRSVIAEFARRSPGHDAEGSPRIEQLTQREREVLVLLTRGRSNAEIAGDLVVSEATVKTHVAHVLMKLGVRDRVQAVIFAYEAGWCRRARSHGRAGHRQDDALGGRGRLGAGARTEVLTARPISTETRLAA